MRLAAVRARVKKIGGTIDDWGTRGFLSWNVISPDRYVWVASKSHTLIAEAVTSNKAQVADMASYLMTAIEQGIEPCSAKDCDECN